MGIADDGNGDWVNVTREVDGGLEDIAVKMPAVITCDLRLNEPRFVKLSNVMKAKKKKIETIDIDSLGVDIEPRIHIQSVSEPPKRSGGVIVEDVDSLVKALTQEAKVL